MIKVITTPNSNWEQYPIHSHQSGRETICLPPGSKLVLNPNNESGFIGETDPEFVPLLEVVDGAKKANTDCKIGAERVLALLERILAVKRFDGGR